MEEFVDKDGFQVIGNRLRIELEAPHLQVLPFFPTYDPHNPAPGIIVDYRNPENCTGHQQRAFMNYWALRSFVESGGGIGLDAGGAGVQHPACLSLDLCGNEPHPVYGGAYSGVHIKGDASDLSMFLDNSFSCILSLHLIEHLPCFRLKDNEPAEEKIRLACSGREIGDILRYHWLRVLKPGGYLASIIPDNKAAVDGGSHVFHQDPSHQHAWSAEEFRQIVLSQVLSLVDVIEYNTFDNHFSLNLVLQKR